MRLGRITPPSLTPFGLLVAAADQRCFFGHFAITVFGPSPGPSCAIEWGASIGPIFLPQITWSVRFLGTTVALLGLIRAAVMW